MKPVFLLLLLTFIQGIFSSNKKNILESSRSAAPMADIETSDDKKSTNILELFKNPDVDARLMARTWFPDAGAGETEEGPAQVEKQIKDMAAAGMGGIELAYISDATNYGNVDAKKYGWGTENWKKIMKTILKTANTVEGGFKVDITITSHWPPSVNNLDPNDIGASAGASYAIKKITKKDIKAGVIELPLPKQKKSDSFRGKPAPFLFEDKFVSAAIARVKEVKEGSSIVIEYASLKDVSDFTSKMVDQESENGFAGYPVGIPDVTYCKEHGIDYQNIIDAFGPDPVNPDFKGKIDADLNRKRMADWQYLYETDLSSLELSVSKGEELAAGDYVIFGNYFRGTGQVMSGGFSVTMYNRNYATDYFSKEGVQHVIDYWADHLLDDELLALLKENARINGTTSIFEDSIELEKEGAAWTHDLLAEFKEFIGYDASDLVPALVVTSNESRGGMPAGMGGLPPGDMPQGMGAPGGAPQGREGAPEGMKGAPEGMGFGAPQGMGGTPGMNNEEEEDKIEIIFDNQEAVNRLKEDYNLVMGNLYSTEHAGEIKKWAKTFGYTYRAQAYPLTGLDVDQAALAVDVPEGDNATAGDGVRQFASAINMSGKKMLSMESTTFSASIISSWETIASRLNCDFADGINRSIVHGSPFSRTFNGYYSNWPGWNFGRYADMEDLHGYGFSTWNARQIYWEDANTITNYVARTQAVLQNGQAQIDLVVLIGTDAGFSNQAGNSLRLLLNNGYTYNVMSEPILKLDNATVKDGILAPNGPAYKAMIVKEARKMSASAMAKVLEYVKNGLPVIFYNSDITDIYGTEKAGNTLTLLQKSMSELKSGKYNNVDFVTSVEEILESLIKSNVSPSASYQQSKLETTKRVADEGVYYYILNANGAPFNAGGPAEREPEMKENHGHVNEDYSVHATLTLEGDGFPYELNAWTGEIKPIAKYEAKDGKIKLDVELKGYDATIIAILKDASGASSVQNLHATNLSGGKVEYAVNKLIHKAKSAGTYNVKLSDGTEKTVKVKSVPEPFTINSGWNLKLQSWGPSEKAANLEKVNQDYSVDPTVSEKVDIFFNNIELGIWNDLPTTAEQYKMLGVDDMGDVVGIGVYTTTFELSKAWESGVGACLYIGHNTNDVIAEVVVNGHLIDDIDQFTNTIDVGKYLQKGKNTILIKLDSTLMNRDPSSNTKTTYGVTEVKLIPYVETELRSLVTSL